MDQYFQKLGNKNVLVLGLGISNRPLVEILLQYGAKVTGCDRSKREQLDDSVLEMEKKGLTLQLGPSYLDNLQGDVAFRTPGLHPNMRQLIELREKGTVITSEMEAFFQICPCKIIAVTGSDGKTTTTTLTAEILKRAGKKVWVGGNIGAPLLPLVEKMGKEDVAVVELSSFQLMNMTIRPHVAVITNIAPNHLDVHKDMQEYTTAKEEIYKNQTEQEVLILNLDNEITKGFAPKASAQIVWFSRREEPANGVFLQDGMIYRKNENGTQKIMEQSDIAIPGIHNVENYMAAICAVGDMVRDEDIVAVAREFGGVEHRIELVRVKDGVRYYNDSIASSPSRTMAGLRSFDKKIILIAGGYDKNLAFEELGREIVLHVKKLVLTGATAIKIKEAVLQAKKEEGEEPEITVVENFYEAITYGAKIAQEGDVVMMSPASASFDNFPNFMVRGEAFKKTIMEL